MGLVALVMFTLFGTVFAAMFHAAGAPTILSAIPCFLLPLFVLAVLAINTGFGIYVIRAANKYKQEEQQYLQRRQQLLATMPAPTAPPRL